MSALSLKNEKHDEYHQIFNRFTQENSQLQLSSFSRFPNGFLVNNNTDSTIFFNETLKEPSNRDKLSKLISSKDFIKKIATSSFELSIPTTLFSEEENILALKIINDSLLLWTENFVYKIPGNDKSAERIELTKKNIEKLQNLDPEIQKYFLMPTFTQSSDILIQKSIRCNEIDLSNKTIQELDTFISNYFKLIFNTSTQQEQLYRGLQHGDFHFRNILKNKVNNYLLTDLDMLSDNGFPFIDILHFAIHLVRNIEKSSQYQPLQLFLSDKSYLYNRLVTYKFTELADIWLQYYNDAYIDIYIQSQLAWYHYNKVISTELDELKTIQKNYIA